MWFSSTSSPYSHASSRRIARIMLISPAWYCQCPATIATISRSGAVCPQWRGLPWSRSTGLASDELHEAEDRPVAVGGVEHLLHGEPADVVDERPVRVLEHLARETMLGSHLGTQLILA